MSLGRCGLMALIVAFGNLASADPGPVPQWLWSDVLSEARPDDNSPTMFATSFDVRPGLKTARLEGRVSIADEQARALHLASSSYGHLSGAQSPASR